MARYKIFHLFISSLQICSLDRSDSFRAELLEIPTAERIQNRMKTITGISSQFVDDVNLILDKCGSSYYVIMVLSEVVSKLHNHFCGMVCKLNAHLLGIISIFLWQMINIARKLNGEKEKITVETVKEQCKMDPDYKTVDGMHVLHTILLRELPPERIGGIINLVLSTRPSATTEEIEDSLVCNDQYI